MKLQPMNCLGDWHLERTKWSRQRSCSEQAETSNAMQAKRFLIWLMNKGISKRTLENAKKELTSKPRRSIHGIGN